MQVGFYLQNKDNPLYYVYASIMLASIRATMPGVKVTQFTDMESNALRGVDDVLRKPSAPMSHLRSSHFASVTGEWLFIDTDVVIRQDVHHVFDYGFDIAVADRNWPHQPTPVEFNERMPHNAGVIFSRSQEFWREIHQEIVDHPPQQDWYGDQQAICDLVKTKRYRVHVLNGFVYNYPPANQGDPAVHAEIVHAKGERKPWLLNYMYTSQQG